MASPAGRKILSGDNLGDLISSDEEDEVAVAIPESTLIQQKLGGLMSNIRAAKERVQDKAKVEKSTLRMLKIKQGINRGIPRCSIKV